MLEVCADQIVKRVPSDGQHRLPVAFRIVEAVEKVNASRAGGSDAYTQPAGIFRVAAGGERRGLLVPNLYELQLVLMGPKGFKHSVYTISWKTEDYFYSPIDEPLYDHVCYCHHILLRILQNSAHRISRRWFELCLKGRRKVQMVRKCGWLLANTRLFVRHASRTSDLGR